MRQVERQQVQGMHVQCDSSAADAANTGNTGGCPNKVEVHNECPRGNPQDGLLALPGRAPPLRQLHPKQPGEPTLTPTCTVSSVVEALTRWTQHPGGTQV